MITTQKLILPVALGAALLGGTVGAFIHSNKPAETAANTTATTANTTTTAPAQFTDKTAQAGTLTADKNVAATDEQTAQNGSADDQAAYRDGFAEGFRTAQETGTSRTVTSRSAAQQPVRVVNTPQRVVYRSTRPRYVADSGSRRAYYDYGQPRSRSFWDKHRDKLTVAMGTGGGALLGGLLGGKKGAAIGALAGGGGSALYTYKIRNRSRRY